MFTLKNTKIVPLTRELAEEFASMPTYDGDRSRETPQGIARIAWLERILKEEKFHSPKWATAQLNGTKFRVNGGHSSYMLAMTDTFPDGLCAVIDEFQCESTDDLADLFDQFDARNSIRTQADKINAHKALHEQLRPISNTDVRFAISGIAWYMIHVSQTVKSLDEDARTRLIHNFPKFVIWGSNFVKARHLSRSGVIAAMFGTWSRDPSEASTFWTLVKDQSHPDNKHPTRVLASFLIQSKTDASSNGRGNKWAPRAFYVKSILGWNAHKHNRTTDLKYHPDAQLPRIA